MTLYYTSDSVNKEANDLITTFLEENVLAISAANHRITASSENGNGLKKRPYRTNTINLFQAYICLDLHKLHTEAEIR